MSTKYWVELNHSDEPTIVSVDVTKETEMRVYFDKKSAKAIIGRCWYVPSWQYKTSVRLFDTMKQALENCALTYANMIVARQDEIKELEAIMTDMQTRLANLKE